MVKKVLLFTMMWVLVSVGLKAEFCTSFSDTAQISSVSRITALQQQSLNLAETDAAASFLAAKKLLFIPDAGLTNQQKGQFFRTLAGKLEKAHHFEQALKCYKISDSLATAKVEKNNLSVTKAAHPGSKYLYLIVLLLVLLLAFLIYVILKFIKANAHRKALAEKQNQLNKELNKLQSDLDAKVRSGNRSLFEELDAMKEKEVALKAALKKAEEAGFLRNAFIANLGFDVRTPLNGIIGFAAMLETELAVRKNLELYDYASSIEKSGHRLLKLLNNVIDLSSLESNALKLDILPTNLEPVMKNIYDRYETQARGKGLIFKSKVDSDLRPVLADEKGLEKVLMQIVDNAVKYTDDGFVTLSAVYDSKKDIDVIEIKDTGPGIDAKHQKLLFDLGIASDNAFLKYGEGTGIGLKLAKKLTDLMNAGMDIESSPGSGTTFRLIFPCSKKAVIERSQPQQSQAVEVTTAAELGDLDIFVLEDDRMNRLILEKMLKNMGQVRLAVDGDDCMEIIDSEAAKGHFFQIMLFDINLPGEKDGVVLMKEVREKYAEYRKVPFIAQTAYAMTQDEEYFLKEGFDSYLSKPINRDELISTVKQQFAIFGSAKK